MTPTDKFNIKRFGSVLSQYFSINRKQLIGGIIVLLGLLTLIAFYVGTINKNNIGSAYSDYALDLSMRIPETQCQLFSMVFCLFSMISASLTFCSFKSKKRRITSLMLPGGKSEMFLARVLIYSVLSNLMFAICCITADALRTMLVYGPSLWAAIEADRMSMFCSAEYWQVLITCTLLNQAIFTLGSAMWPRNSFIKTFGVLFALIMLAAIAEPLHGVYEEFFEFIYFHFTWLEFSPILFAICIVIYWLAWLRFKNMQVIQRFMLK